MIKALTPVAALLLSVAILLTGQGLQSTLIPVRAALENFSTLSIGLMTAAYFFGFTLGCLRGGELVRRVGHVRVFLAMTAIGSSTPLINGLVVEVWVWVALRMVVGFCFAVLYVVIESWLNECSTNENRGTVFSAYVMISLTVMAAGQMMTLLYDPKQLQLFALASVLVSLCAIPVALSTSTVPQQPTRSKVDLPLLFRISPAGTVGCLVAGLSNGAFWGLAPLFVAGITGDARMAAWFMTAAVLGGALLQWPLGMISDRYGRRGMLLYTSLSAAIAAIILALSSGAIGFVGVCLLGAVWGSSAFPLYSIAVAHANDHAAADQFVVVSGGLLMMYGIGAIFGPFIAAAVMSVTESYGLYLFTAVVHLLMFGYVLARIRQRKAIPDEQHMPFAESLAATHTKSQIFEEAQQDASDEKQTPPVVN